MKLLPKLYEAANMLRNGTRYKSTRSQTDKNNDRFIIFAGWLAGWLAALLVGWLAGWLACLLAGWLAGWLAGRLAGWLDAWLASCLAGWLASWVGESTPPLKSNQTMSLSWFG